MWIYFRRPQDTQVKSECERNVIGITDVVNTICLRSSALGVSIAFDSASQICDTCDRCLPENPEIYPNIVRSPFFRPSNMGHDRPE